MMDYNRYKELKDDSLAFYAMIKDCELRLGCSISESDFESCKEIYFDSDDLSYDSDFKDMYMFLFSRYNVVGALASYLEPFDWQDSFELLEDMPFSEYVDLLLDSFDKSELEDLFEDLNDIIESFGLDYRFK